MLCLQLGIDNVINVQNDQDNVLHSTLQRSHHVDISAEGEYETIQFVQRPKFPKVRYSTGHDNVLLFKLRCQDGVFNSRENLLIIQNIHFMPIKQFLYILDEYRRL